MGEYELDGHHVHLLRLLCEALDRCAQARELLDRDGLLIEGRFGAKAHPCVGIEREAADSRRPGCFVRKLNLDGDVVAAPEPGRPLGRG